MWQNKLLFVEIQTVFEHAPQVEIIYYYCMQNNQWKFIGDQLQAKSPIELEDNP